MTAMVWVKGASQASKTVFANWDNTATTYKQAWKIYSGSNGTSIAVRIADTTTQANYKDYTTATADVAFDSTWHLVGFTYTGGANGTLTGVYIDGTARTGGTSANGGTGVINSIDANGSTAYALMSIGCEMTTAAATAGTYFNGSIDSARFYSAAIPTSQIQQMYYAGLNRLMAEGQVSQDQYQNRIANLASSVAVK
jgi:hypothetical protein